MYQQSNSKDINNKFHLKNLFVLPESIKSTYIQDSIQKNHYALNIIVLLVFVIESFNITRVLFFSKSGLGTLNNRIYFGMYCILLLGGLAAIIIERWMKHHEMLLFRLYIAGAYFWMIWHVLLNCYDLMKDSTSGTIILLTALFGISVFIQMPPGSAVVIYLSSFFLFLILSKSVLDIGIIINISISVIVAMFITITRYNYIITELVQKMEINLINEQLKKEQEELRISLEKHVIIMEQSNEVIFEWDILQDKMMISHNGEVEFSCPAVIEEVNRWIIEDSAIFQQDKQIFVDMLQKCLKGNENGETEIRIKNQSGQFTWYCARIFLQYDASGKPVNGIGVFSDIDKQKNHLTELTIQLQIDPLTGILNKLAFQNSIQEYSLNLSDDVPLSMFMLDLDNFKSINDTYGHPYGDYVLKETAKAMQKVFRENDFLGRLGGDEFAVILPNIKDTRILSEKANLLLKEISNIKFKEKDFSISCSIGISIVRGKEMKYDEFYKSADSALYEAKAMGKGCYKILEG